MLGWAIGFFVAALVAAVFGFGGIASAFTGIAIILFWVFVALFVLSLIFGGLRGGGAVVEGGHARGGFGGFGVVALIAVVAIVAYAWVKNDWSAQQVGAEIDQTASQLADNTGEVIEGAGERAADLTHEATNEIRNDASQGLDEASDNAAPDGNGDDHN